MDQLKGVLVFFINPSVLSSTWEIADFRYTQHNKPQVLFL